MAISIYNEKLNRIVSEYKTERDADKRNDLFILILRFMSPAIRRYSKHFYIAGHDKSDLRQIASMAILEAIRIHHPDAGNFSALASRIIYCSLCSQIKKGKNNKNNTLNSACSLDAERGDDGDGLSLHGVVESIYDQTQDKDRAELEAKKTITLLVSSVRLSGLERRILSDWMSEHTYAQIAERNGCNKKTVDNAMTRVRMKLRVAAT